MTRAIEINPQLAEAWCNKGNALINQSKYDQALQASDRAIEINPLLAEAWNNKGIALKLLGRNRSRYSLRQSQGAWV